jgi:hypothetical protein
MFSFSNASDLLLPPDRLTGRTDISFAASAMPNILAGFWLTKSDWRLRAAMAQSPRFL